MFEKSVRAPAFYRPDGVADDGSERFESRSTTSAAWSAETQHGGPPAALLMRAIEGLEAARGRVLGRFAMDLWGPVPVGPVSVRAVVLRDGRSVMLAEAQLRDLARDRVVATGRAWLFPEAEGPTAEQTPLPHSPEDGVRQQIHTSWSSGYGEVVEWRWVEGVVGALGGEGTVWMRTPDLVDGEQISPVQRLLVCVDSASGASAALDIREWAFLNTELTVHVLRPPVGEWICLDARTRFGGGAVGLATSDVYDEKGLVAHSGQALLVVRR